MSYSYNVLSDNIVRLVLFSTSLKSREKEGTINYDDNFDVFEASKNCITTTQMRYKRLMNYGTVRLRTNKTVNFC